MTQAKEILPVFIWEGRRGGKSVNGTLAGKNASAVRIALRRQGIQPKKVKKKRKPLLGSSGKIKSNEITMFSRQLATMMSSGVPLVQAFEITGSGHDNPAMRELLLSVKSDVEAGNSLTDSMRKFPQHFNPLFCNLVEAGEKSGILEAVLDKVATYQEKTEALKGKVKSALFYPTAVIVAAVIVVSILMIFVIPQFESLFQDFGADLPGLTQLLIDISRFFQSNWWVMILFIVGVATGFTQLRKRSSRFGELLDIAMLRVPIIGVVLEKAAVARFCRTLATMFAAGTPLVEAMTSVAGACGNIVYYKASMVIRGEIAVGTQLQAAMREVDLFPNVVVEMVKIGEESGALDTMLSKSADWYEREVDDAVDALSSLLEPAIMAFLGVVIGGIVIGMYLPIFKLGSVI